MRLQLDITNKGLVREVEFQPPDVTQEDLDRKLERVVSEYFRPNKAHPPMIRGSLIGQMHWCPWQGIVRDYYPPGAEDLDDAELFDRAEGNAIMAKGTHFHDVDLPTHGDVKVSDSVRPISKGKSVREIEAHSIKPQKLEKKVVRFLEKTRDDAPSVFEEKLKEHSELLKLGLSTDIRKRFLQHKEIEHWKDAFDLSASVPVKFRELYLRVSYGPYLLFGHPDEVFLFRGEVAAHAEYKTTIKQVPSISEGARRQSLTYRHLLRTLFGTKEFPTFIVSQSQRNDFPPTEERHEYDYYPVFDLLSEVADFLHGKDPTVTGNCPCEHGRRCPWALNIDGERLNPSLSPEGCLTWYREKSRWGEDSWKT